jgi:hypothetical protein
MMEVQMANQSDTQRENLSLDQLIQEAVNGTDIALEGENIPGSIVLISRARYDQLTQGQRNPDFIVKMGQRNPDAAMFEVQGQRNPDVIAMGQRNPD